MEIDESDDAVPDDPVDDAAPADDNGVEMEGTKEEGAPQNFNENAQEEEDTYNLRTDQRPKIFLWMYPSGS